MDIKFQHAISQNHLVTLRIVRPLWHYYNIKLHIILREYLFDFMNFVDNEYSVSFLLLYISNTNILYHIKKIHTRASLSDFERVLYHRNRTRVQNEYVLFLKNNITCWKPIDRYYWYYYLLLLIY
jgi:hypothetical protein